MWLVSSYYDRVRVILAIAIINELRFFRKEVILPVPLPIKLVSTHPPSLTQCPLPNICNALLILLALLPKVKTWFKQEIDKLNLSKTEFYARNWVKSSVDDDECVCLSESVWERKLDWNRSLKFRKVVVGETYQVCCIRQACDRQFTFWQNHLACAGPLVYYRSKRQELLSTCRNCKSLITYLFKIWSWLIRGVLSAT